jgi:hypothetical protein
MRATVALVSASLVLLCALTPSANSTLARASTRSNRTSSRPATGPPPPSTSTATPPAT